MTAHPAITHDAHATCRGCGAHFTATGWAAQSSSSPRLCRDCEVREREYHPRHAPAVVCLAEHMRRT